MKKIRGQVSSFFGSKVPGRFLSGVSAAGLLILSFQTMGDVETSLVRLFGEANMGADLLVKPTSKEGDLNFQLRQMKVGVAAELDEEAQVQLVLSADEDRNATQGSSRKLIVQLDSAELNLYTHFGTWTLGLTSHPWLISQGEYLDFELWGPSSRPMIRRYKYVAESDQGVRWTFENESGGKLEAALFNGEENRSEELGPKKDLVFVWDQAVGQSYLGIGGSFGRYDLYSPVNEKNRVMLRGRTLWGRAEFGFEALWAQDSADAVTHLGLAEGVDLSATLPGRKTTAEGASVWGLYHLSERENLFFRVDSLNPSRETPEKGVQAGQIAYSRQYSESITLALFYEQVQKDALHSNTSLTQEKLGGSAKVQF